MNDDDEPEPYLERLIDETIGPVAHLLSAEELALLRQALRNDVKGDAHLAKLLRAALPRTPPLQTQEEPTDPRAVAPPEGAAVVPLRRKGGAT